MNKRILIPIIAAGIALTATSVAVAQTASVDTVVRGPAGSTQSVTTIQVDRQDQGHTCTLTVTSRNQESVHVGNVLNVSTGGELVLALPHFEDIAFDRQGTSGTVTLGPTIDVTVTLGADGVSSAGVDVVTDCTPPVTTSSTTTSSIPPTVTTVPAEQPPTTPRFTG
jgi:hypothetical protein